VPDAPELSGPDLDDVDEDAPTFKRRIAIAVVMVTFFGAVIAYFHAVESNKEDVAARAAEIDAIQGMGAQVDASSQFVGEMRIASSAAVERQRQAIAATLVAGLSDDPDDPNAAAVQRFAAQVAAYAALTGIDVNEQETFNDTRAGLFEAPDEARLRQTVNADRANAHGDKADSYVAVITVLAVALFLLGLSLTVGGRGRYVLAAPGVALAVGCVAFAGLIFLRSTVEVSDRAVSLTAQGGRLHDAGDLEAAIDSYDEAIEDSPDFAAAFARRAASEFDAGSEQQGQTVFRSITSPEALERALADAERALELGGDADLLTITAAGFFSFLDGDFERSIDLTTQAVEQNDGLAQIWFNLGVAQLGAGEDDEAEDSYREGLRTLDDVADAGTRSAILAGARTDLSILRDIVDADDLDDVEDDIEAVEAELADFEVAEFQCVLEEGEPAVPCPEIDAGAVTLGEATFGRSGPFTEVVFDIDGLDPGQRVGVAWYFRTDDSAPFEQAGLPFEGGVVLADGRVFSSTLPSLDVQCPVAGEYLVRLYGGGQLLGEATGSLEPTLFGTDFEFVRDPVEGFNMCSPAGFTVERADVSQSDAFTSFLDPDQQLSIAVNVVPGALPDTSFADEFEVGTVSGFVPGAEQRPVRFLGLDVAGGFVDEEGVMAVDTGQGLGVAMLAGPDLSSRVVMVQGPDVTFEMVQEAALLAFFTDVGTTAG
jgi:tetratricopeptide (TPR) repeat protein